MYKPMEAVPRGSAPAGHAKPGDVTEESAVCKEERVGEAVQVNAEAASLRKPLPADQAGTLPAASTGSAAPQGTLDFDALFQQYYRPLSSFLYRMLGDLQLAQDVTQDCFMKLHLAMQAGQPLVNVRAWLYRVATNAALDERRRRKHITWLPLLATSERHESEHLDPEDQVILRDRLQQVLAGISPNLAVCLLLHLHHGFSHDEIACILGISSGAARTRLQRGREAFKERWLMMEGHGPSGRSEAISRSSQRSSSRTVPPKGRSAMHAEEDNGGSLHETSET